MNIDDHVELAGECGVLGNFAVDLTINFHVEGIDLAVMVKALRDVDFHDAGHLRCSFIVSVPPMKITVRVNLLTVNHKITVRVIFLAPRVISAYFKDMITAVQIRAARAILNWKQTDLAVAAGVSEMSIKNLEKGQTDPRVSTLRAIEDAFARSGIEFISTPEKEGVVRMRDRQA